MTRAKGERSEVIMNEIPNVNYEFVSIHHLSFTIPDYFLSQLLVNSQLR
jgi:hypothetical protein